MKYVTLKIAALGFKVLSYLTLGLLFIFSAGSAWAFPPSGGAHGGAHGKNPEPTTVLPLKANLEHDLAIHDGIVDAVTGPAKPALSIRVLKLEPDSVVVEIHNLSSDTLKLSLFQVMQDGRFSPASSCPLKPGASSIEAWPEAFDAIGFGTVKVLMPDEAMACE
jgi:hypothetical protein